MWKDASDKCSLGMPLRCPINLGTSDREKKKKKKKKNKKKKRQIKGYMVSAVIHRAFFYVPYAV